MGQLSYQAVLHRDYPLIMAIFTVSAVMTLIGILLADFLYTVVDPRITYEKRAGA
jgi:peptide/nickel transport system permease protein